jgi:hypothetical protein
MIKGIERHMLMKTFGNITDAPSACKDGMMAILYRKPGLESSIKDIWLRTFISQDKA